MEPSNDDGLVVFSPPKPDRSGMHKAQIERFRRESLKETGAAERTRFGEEQGRQRRHDSVELDVVAEVYLPEPTVVPNAKIKQNLDKALGSLQYVFSSAAKAVVGDMHLDEIEVGLEIGADGSVGIPGLGVKISGKSTVTVRFKRAEAPKTSDVQ